MHHAEVEVGPAHGARKTSSDETEQEGLVSALVLTSAEQTPDLSVSWLEVLRLEECQEIVEMPRIGRGCQLCLPPV